MVKEKSRGVDLKRRGECPIMTGVMGGVLEAVMFLRGEGEKGVWRGGQGGRGGCRVCDNTASEKP